jgi:hypothetical protein
MAINAPFVTDTSMNELRRLAAKIDQHNQQIACPVPEV